jgi:glycosyltransferase involved in cell wall biosynthesis
MPPTDSAKPLVTIIVPAYNRAGGLLEQTLDSILSQDYPNIELLVLDDGSTDQTPEVLERYATRHPERMRWERHENMGQARTLNKGFEMARGEYVGYISSDDQFLPGAISKLAQVLIDDPEAVLVYPSYEVIDEDGEVVNRIVPPEYSRVESVRLQDTIVGPGAIYRAAEGAAAGPWRREYLYLADFEFWLRLSLRGPFVRLTEPLAAWRRHEGALTLADTGRTMAEERLRLLDEVIAGDSEGSLRPVQAEAYRNAYVLGATVVARAPDPLSSRFHIVDRHARVTAQASGSEDADERLDRARVRMAAQERRIGELERQVATGAAGGPARGFAARLRGAAGSVRRKIRGDDSGGHS